MLGSAKTVDFLFDFRKQVSLLSCYLVIVFLGLAFGPKHVLYMLKLTSAKFLVAKTCK